MGIADSIESIKTSKEESEKLELEDMLQKVQILIQEACEKYGVAFFRDSDEWTFVDLKDPKPDDANSEGNWHYAGFRGDHIDKDLPDGMREDLLAIQKLVYTKRLRPESFPNGISAKLEKNVRYRLGYLVNCP